MVLKDLLNSFNQNRKAEDLYKRLYSMTNPQRVLYLEDVGYPDLLIQKICNSFDSNLEKSEILNLFSISNHEIQGKLLATENTTIENNNWENIHHKFFNLISDLYLPTDGLVAFIQPGYPKDVYVSGDFKNKEVGSFLIYQDTDHFEATFINENQRQENIYLYENYLLAPVEMDENNQVPNGVNRIKVADTVEAKIVLNNFFIKIRALQNKYKLETDRPQNRIQLLSDLKSFLEFEIEKYEKWKFDGYDLDGNRVFIAGDNTKLKPKVYIKFGKCGDIFLSFNESKDSNKLAFIDIPTDESREVNSNLIPEAWRDLEKNFKKISITQIYSLAQIFCKKYFDLDYKYENFFKLSPEGEKNLYEVEKAIFKLFNISDFTTSKKLLLVEQNLQRFAYDLFDYLFPKFDLKKHDEYRLTKALKMVFNKSFNEGRIHGSLASSHPKGIIELNGALNCEMRAAMMAIAFEKLGESPILCTLDVKGIHYAVALYNQKDGILTIYDPFKYKEDISCKSYDVKVAEELNLNMHSKVRFSFNDGSSHALRTHPIGLKYSLPNAAHILQMINKSLLKDSELVVSDSELNLYRSMDIPEISDEVLEYFRHYFPSQAITFGNI